VTHLTAFRGGWDGELVAWSYYRDPTKPNYGMPEIYMLRNLGVPIARIPAPGSKLTGRDVLPPQAQEYSTIISWVHESRLLVFPGKAVSRRARVQMRGWGDSVFTRCAEVLSQYDQTWGGIANLMTDFPQGVLKVEGLTDRLMGKGPTGAQGGGASVVAKKAMSVQMARSIARVMMLDSKDEFSRDTVALTGIADTMEQFALRLAAAADMPVDLLMGQGAGGALNKGDTTYRFFMDRVAARQKKEMLPQLRQLIRWVFRSKEGPTGGREPEKWTVKFCALYQESDKERAERMFQIAQADHIYIQDQVVTPEEVAATRFAGSEYSDGPIVIDFEGRQAMADQDAADKEARQAAMVQSATQKQTEQEEAKQKAEAAAKEGKPPAGGEGGAQEGGKPEPGADAKGGSHKVTIAISKGDAEWNEEDHPREENGKFGSGGGGGGDKATKEKPITSYPKRELKPVTSETKAAPHHPVGGDVNDPQKMGEYHRGMQEHFKSRGEHEIARGHEAIAEKYEKRAARARRKDPSTPKG